MLVLTELEGDVELSQAASTKAMPSAVIPIAALTALYFTMAIRTPLATHVIEM
jgi:hypothetical protein